VVEENKIELTIDKMRNYNSKNESHHKGSVINNHSRGEKTINSNLSMFSNLQKTQMKQFSGKKLFCDPNIIDSYKDQEDILFGYCSSKSYKHAHKISVESNSTG
jgi:hypothetical protein